MGDTVGTYGYGQEFVPLNNIRLLEAGCYRAAAKQAQGDLDICGDFLKCRKEDGCPGVTPSIMPGNGYTRKLMKLHHAEKAIKAMQMATTKAFDRTLKSRGTSTQ